MRSGVRAWIEVDEEEKVAKAVVSRRAPNDAFGKSLATADFGTQENR